VALLGLIFVTADYLLRKEQLKYITVEQLVQRRSKAQASKQKSKLAKTINLVVLGVGFGVAAIALILAGGYWLTGSNLLSPEPLPTSHTTPALTDTPRPSTGKWETQLGQSSFDDSQTVMTTGKAGGLKCEPLKAVIVSRLRRQTVPLLPKTQLIDTAVFIFLMTNVFTNNLFVYAHR
jgi:hypothetical protein